MKKKYLLLLTVLPILVGCSNSCPSKCDTEPDVEFKNNTEGYVPYLQETSESGKSFIVDKNGRAVSYYGENSVESIMNQLSLFYPDKEYSQGHLIALNDGVVFITLEPAAQIETSIIPGSDLFKISHFLILILL